MPVILNMFNPKGYRYIKIYTVDKVASAVVGNKRHILGGG